MCGWEVGGERSKQIIKSGRAEVKILGVQRGEDRELKCRETGEAMIDGKETDK